MRMCHGRALALGVVGLLAAACAGPGQGITEKIRAADSATIREVHYAPSNMLNGHREEIFVFLTTDATDAEVVDVWCNVVVPAGIDQLPHDAVGFYRSGDLDPNDVNYGAHPLDKPAC